METIFFWLLCALVAGLSLVTLLYVLEIAAAFAAVRSLPALSPGEPRPAAAILVPAHNEELVLARTLAAIHRAKGPDDRILVVADNCTDATASIARAAGAEVLERHDTERRGKGYALDAGVRHLAENPPAIVIVIDADCLPDAGAVERLVQATAAAQRPVQSLNLMTAAETAPLGLKVAQFAFALKNRVRMRGLHRLGLPCHLTGTGMAFPWSVLRQADLASGHLAEDIKLSIDLTSRGQGPLFCEDALVLSFFPSSAQAVETQRSRWIGGHMALIAQASRTFPGLLLRGNLTGAITTLATMIPPMTILLALLLACLLLSAAASISMGPALLALSFVNLLAFVLATGAAWYRFGRDILPAQALKGVPLLVLARIARMPATLLASRGGAWIRTDRGSAD